MMTDLFVGFSINVKKIILKINQRMRKNRYTYIIIRNNKLRCYNAEYMIIYIKIDI